ncbi:hypothetical protein Salat_2138700 [Sesamum alatum]|uniref:Reverse transcriptase zinc-binding domain-containing protein n=1 Tax=Sesamum alatum TaxID=300844 RepID=A0AAE2CGZ6_9LAMI|nr:hypothetical protein Salat_2138700 [Sesamum alatum]
MSLTMARVRSQNPLFQSLLGHRPYHCRVLGLHCTKPSREASCSLCRWCSTPLVVTPEGVGIEHVRLWSVPVPPRVWLQAWKFCHNAVPTLENLARFRPELDRCCNFNGADLESLQHVLRECPYTPVIWALSNIPWFVISADAHSVADWFVKVFERIDGQVRLWFLIICWSLWRCRNTKVMEGGHTDPLQLVHDASVLLFKYEQARAAARTRVLV